MIVLEHIKKQYGENTVLDDISLEIGKGEIVSILGPSGGGKTTLLNVLLGITDITSGRILCDGEDITHVPMEKRGFNIVFQDYALFPNLNAYENITYGLRNNPTISSKEEVEELIELLGLKEHLSKKISELSGGQKQRVALARTLVMKPRLLLLDESLSALDGVIKESIKQKIKQIVDQYQLTTVMVTHDPEEALTMSDKILILNGGKSLSIQHLVKSLILLKASSLKISSCVSSLSNAITFSPCSTAPILHLYPRARILKLTL